MKSEPMPFYRRFAALAAVALAAALCGCRTPQNPPATTVAALPIPPARELPSDAAASEDMIRFLGARLKRDPDDFASQNRLAATLLQRVRETGDVAYLAAAERAARASLRSVPAEVNFGGLSTLAQVEFAGHEFAKARDHARRLTELDPTKSEYFGMLGDDLLELGEYDKASGAFANMAGLNHDGIGTQTRLARFSLLHGRVDEAQKRLIKALDFTMNLSNPPRETAAWCRWQLGETAFSIGDYATAERHYRDALITFPGYLHALASLGRVLAARGDLAGAIRQYEQAVKVIPDPTLVAALGDLYLLAGRVKEAKAQYRLVEVIGHLSRANGVLYNRQLALFYADHDLKPQQAYQAAVQEYAVRRDIYGADALAWTALKAGHITHAQSAIKQALRLGTHDARLFYHAGLIAKAAGDKKLGHVWLQRALKLNPHFDPLQSKRAAAALAAL